MFDNVLLNTSHILTIRYDTTGYDIFSCVQKLTGGEGQLNQAHGTRNEKNKEK